MENTQFIVRADVGLRVRSAPNSKDQNNIVDKLKNNQVIKKLSQQDSWYEVEYSLENGFIKKGWVSSEFLSPLKSNAETVVNIKPAQQQNNLPDFKIGIPNLFSDFNAKKVREIIKDEFGGGANKWDLQCTEYVCYKIKQSGVTISWPVKSGRDGGKWANIFISNNMYKVLDTPKEGCAMCFTGGLEKTSAKNTGHIAYVEKVYGDESIFISEANWPGVGKYNERKLIKANWKDKYKAKFVDFT